MRALTPSHRGEIADKAVDDMLGDDVDFGRYVVAVWRHVSLVAVVAVLCGALVATAALLRPRVYEASAMLAVSSSKLGENASAAAAANFRPLIENNSVAAQVIKDFQLAASPYNLSPDAFLRDTISVEEIRNSNLIRLHVALRNPSVAAQVANRISDLAVEGARRLNQNEAVQARDELAREVQQAKAQLEGAAARLQTFQNTAQVELTRADVKSLLEEREGLLQLLAHVEGARAKVRRGEAELAGRKRVESLTKTIDTDPALSEAAREADPARSVLGLQIKSEEVNKTYEAIEQQLAEDRAELAELEARRAELIETRKLDAQQQSQLSSLYRKEAELSRLTTEHELAEKSYREIVSRYDVARLQIAGRSAELQVIDRAIVPDTPESRHLFRNTMFATLAAASVMALLIVLAQALSDVLKAARRP